MRISPKIGAGIAGVLALSAGLIWVNPVKEPNSAPVIPPVATSTTSSISSSTTAISSAVSTAGFELCPLASLPAEVDPVIDAIYAGGPFTHPRNDGTRFGNYEEILPLEDRSYYREYTVDTPGLSHRGARRIVTGGNPPTNPEVWYYTNDHYESFCEIPDA
ncbi:ribonuclease domain-containing protein [Corynebacterium caspium]|uniref:ribonuclease domain-containing protein n=1 Tax=Corynebacterium caspium TaxID=234828 RepID=UPI00037C19C2|nr:ribonuclease domain-containing protein [Corynebacterium caspium]WKD58909.1 Guanyl-specific ribonuclease St [Corynebacterium caspium DSM 44850]